MSVRKSSHGTIFLIVSSGSPRALIASSLRSTSKKPFCPMIRSLHPLMTACGHRVRFVATWREEFFEVPLSFAAYFGASTHAWQTEVVGVAVFLVCAVGGLFSRSAIGWLCHAWALGSIPLPVRLFTRGPV